MISFGASRTYLHSFIKTLLKLKLLIIMHGPKSPVDYKHIPVLE